MSVLLRFTVGPLVLCHLELFARDGDPDDGPPAQLAGGAGLVIDPDPVEPFGFGRAQ